MPTYLYFCAEKHGEFEDYHSITFCHTHCPKCKEETNADIPVKRLICGTTKGVVELYGQDLVDKVKADTETLKKELYSSDTKYANFVGEGTYEKMQQKIDKQRR